MRRLIVSAAFLLVALSAPDAREARNLNELLGACQSLSACIRIVDTNTSSQEREDYVDARLASAFRRFGEPAKQEMLRRATGRDPGWRNVAASVLAYWPGWTEADVPTLRRILLANPRGLVAEPLSKIGSPAAIEAVIEVIKSNKSAFGVAGQALGRLGPKAIPYLMFVPEGPYAISEASLAIGTMMIEDAEPAIRFLAQTAGDALQPLDRRIAALQELSYLENIKERKGEFIGPAMRALLKDPNLAIRVQALAVVRQLDDPILGNSIVLPQLVEACNATTHAFSDRPKSCIEEIAAFGEAAKPFGGEIRAKYLRSPRDDDRADAAIALGVIGYNEAVPDLLDSLHDQDWLVVYAAIHSLGLLGAKQALPTLDGVAATHWLPEVRREAMKVADALRSQPEVLPRPSINPRRVPNFHISSDVLMDVPYCEAWEWQGIQISSPERHRLTVAIPAKGSLPAGTLTLMNGFPNYGSLTWNPRRGRMVYVVNPIGFFIAGIESGGDGAVAVFGGLGFDQVSEVIPSSPMYAVSLIRDASGNWIAKDIGRLVGGDSMQAIALDLYAVQSHNRMIILTPARILGLANCVRGE